MQGKALALHNAQCRWRAEAPPYVFFCCFVIVLILFPSDLTFSGAPPGLLGVHVFIPAINCRAIFPMSLTGQIVQYDYLLSYYNKGKHGTYIMHILMIAPRYFPFDRPRVGAYYHEHALALSCAGAKVAVINVDLRPLQTIRDGELYRFAFMRRVEKIEGITVYKFCGWAVPKNPRINSWLWEWFAYRTALRYVGQCGLPDIIHAQRALLAGSAARRISQKLMIPYVVTEHSSGYLRNAFRDWQQAKIRTVMDQASAISAVSGFLARAISPYTDDLSVSLIPNVVRFDRFPLCERKNKRHFKFLTVCNLERNKNVQSIIEAFAERFAGRSAVTLIVGGAGPDMSKLKKIVYEQGIATQVKFLGLLSQKGVSTAMSNANCFVLASHYETFGVALIEAMATGLPVITTASGGPEEIVTSKVGYVVPINDVGALGASMEKIYYERARWEALGPSIRSYAERRYSQKAVGKRMLEFYRSCLKTWDSE